MKAVGILLNHFVIDPAKALTVIVICLFIDLLSMHLEIKRNIKGKGSSGIPVIAWFAYCMMSFMSSIPLPINGYPRLLYRILNLLLLTGLHITCQYIVPGTHRKWFNGRRTIHRAVLKNSLSRLMRLLDNKTDIESSDNLGWTPLHLAVSLNNIAIVQLLLSRGADANAITNDGTTPLHIATYVGNKEIVDYLLNHGAQVKVADVGGTYLTPLLAAAQQGHLEIFQTLLTYTGTNIEGEMGWPFMECALFRGRLEIVHFLLNNGTTLDPNKKVWFGRTVLAELVSRGPSRHRLELIQLLISKGADVNAIDDAGLTPLKYAQKGHEKDIIYLLKSHGAC